jgi:2-amino-4-hydroxy-6-hydroxymethyldihydropteridine diphosphokinase
LIEDLRITEEKLTIPHPYMEEREFVLAPLREIAPDLILPSGKCVKDIKGLGEVKKISFYSN